jgi:hypothetical protein
MDKKKESFLSDNIQIWMHNESEAQKSEEEQQEIQENRIITKGLPSNKLSEL